MPNRQNTQDKGGSGEQDGYNLHEMRDEAITCLHTHAKNQGFDMDCVKLSCGQVGEIDLEAMDMLFSTSLNTR